MTTTWGLYRRPTLIPTNPLDQFKNAEWFKNMDPTLLPIIMNEYRDPVEVVEWELFDRLMMPTEGDKWGRTRLHFFSHSMGTAPYGEIDTSMHLPGQLPGNRTFIINSMGLVIPRKFRRMWDTMAPWGAFALRISDKVYRHMPAGTVPVYNAGDPIYRKVTRETRVPGKGWRQVTVEESKAPLLTFNPHPVILPCRPFDVTFNYRADLMLSEPFPLMVVLNGWDLRPLL